MRDNASLCDSLFAAQTATLDFVEYLAYVRRWDLVRCSVPDDLEFPISIHGALGLAYE